METQKSTKRQMLKYVGSFSQLFGMKEYTLSGGRADRVKAVDVKTGAGLEFTVVADRCMDIAGLSFNGTNCSYLNKTGIVSPEYYEKDGVGFLPFIVHIKAKPRVQHILCLPGGLRKTERESKSRRGFIIKRVHRFGRTDWADENGCADESDNKYFY